MLTNFHTHSNMCDGKNTLEEIVVAAIEKGFSAIGLSGHGYTDFDLSYCMQDMDAYMKEVNRLKEKYASKIEVYLGVEEDIRCPMKNREDFDYIIGSSHYIERNGKLYTVDMDPETFGECLSAWDGNALALAEEYYSSLCDYILKRKPDIVGHFDLITKFDEKIGPNFLGNAEYNRLAEKYMKIALKSECLFEVNTGAISRGWRTLPYPDENLLYVIKQNGGKIILSSDSHSKDTLDCAFEETKKFLRDVGFEYVYALFGGKFIKDFL